MSEYQFHEFRAVDRPLNRLQMATLRTSASRAQITPSRFVSEYHYGDLRGNSDRWMDLYFDAHLQTTSWGVRLLELRLPARRLACATARRYCAARGEGSCAVARAARGHVVLSFAYDDEDGPTHDGDDRLATMLAVRAELAAGDVRALYLAWLMRVQRGEIDEFDIEPPIPARLARGSAALMAMADFLGLDPALVHAAALHSAGSGIRCSAGHRSAGDLLSYAEADPRRRRPGAWRRRRQTSGLR